MGHACGNILRNTESGQCTLKTLARGGRRKALRFAGLRLCLAQNEDPLQQHGIAFLKGAQMCIEVGNPVRLWLQQTRRFAFHSGLGDVLRGPGQSFLSDESASDVAFSIADQRGNY